MPSLVDLQDPGFWRNSENHVMFNARSAQAEKCAAQVQRWIEATDAKLAGSIWIATSGSSGRPRFVRLSKSGMLQSARAVNQHIVATSADRWLCALPSFHVGGIAIYARAVQAGNEVHVFDEPWRAKSFCAALEYNQTTLTSLVPTQVYDLVKNHYPCPEHLRLVIVGGERMSSQLGQAARDLGWPVLQSYGLSEASSQVATESLEALRGRYLGDKLELLSCWQVKIKEDTQCLQIKGNPICLDYLDFCDDERGLYVKALDRENWFTTGDFAELEKSADGQVLIRVTGRVDDRIKILGEQVSMNEINRRFLAVLHKSDYTLDAYLLALPDPRRGFRIVLVTDGKVQDSEALQQSYQSQVAAYEMIDKIYYVDKIPRSALGKVQRQTLLDLIEHK